MKPDPQERPDFEAMAKKYVLSEKHLYSLYDAYIHACEKIWSDYVIPQDDLSRKRIEELEAALKTIRSEINYRWSFHDQTHTHTRHDKQDFLEWLDKILNHENRKRLH